MTDPNRPPGFRDPDEPRAPGEAAPYRGRHDPYAHSTVARRTPTSTKVITALAWASAAGVAVGSVVLGFGPLAGVQALWGGGATGDRTTEVAEPFTSVDLRSQGVPLTVRYDDVPNARLLETDLPSGLMAYRVEDGRLVVEHEAQSTWWRWFSDEGLTVVLPQSMAAGTPDVRIRASTASVDVLGQYGSVDIQAGTGSIDANGEFEKLNASTGTGSIDVRGAADEIRVETQTGSVDVRPTTADVVWARATTGSVDIRFEGDTQPREVNASTGTGSVEIQVPSGRYDVETRTGTGGTDVGVDQDASSPNKITAETGTGSIDIES